MIIGQDEETVCPNRDCGNRFNHTTATVFHDAPEILFVSMQCKISNGDGTFRKDNRAIDVGGNLRITLESGVITTYQLMGGIEHQGNIDNNGHYFLF